MTHHLKSTCSTVIAAGLAAAVVASAPPAGATAVAAGSDAPPGGHARLEKQMRKDLADVRRTYDVPGGTVEVRTAHGRVVVRSGVGDKRTGAPIPRGAHFRIASFTKTFVSATLLQLVDEGRLSLDDPVETWLPGLVRGHGNDGRAITVRMLLQHTTGLPDYLELQPLFTKDGFQENRFQTLTAREVVKDAVGQDSHFEPGSQWEYSNTNYALAGLVIESVSGTSWREQVRERIIEPLDLRHTSAPYTRTTLPRPHARGYERFLADGATPENPRWTSAIDATRLNPSWAGAAGGMVSTTADGNRFLRALVTGKVLSPRMLREMQTTVPLSPAYQKAFPGARYGLGIFWIPSQCGGYWSHGGDIMGFMTRNGVTPDGRRSVVVSYNTDSPVPRDGAKPSDQDPSNVLIQHALCGS